MTTDKQWVEQILERISRINCNLENYSKKDFLASATIQDAIICNFMYIGEACRQLSDDFRNTHPEIPWKAVIGMRNVLIHDYINTDLDLVWSIAVGDIPQLKANLQEILKFM